VSVDQNELVLEIEKISSVKELDEFRVRVLGKSGSFTEALKSIATLSVEEKKTKGRELNMLKTTLEEKLQARLHALKQIEINAKLSAEWIDVTLPVKSSLPETGAGSLHPLTKVQRELEDIFRGLGFTVVDGPEVEKERYNFDALNIPTHHPARDMQDTFWTKEKNVLRTHTSSMQIRALETMQLPLRIVAPGRVFRAERVDASHDHTFYQMEGMMIDRNISISHLHYFMRTLLREILGFDPKIRLRPGYFPFVEPGFELDIWFKNKWMELLPCGLVHPRVLELTGHDPKEWQGFAFGLGLSRLVMSRFEIDDVRHLQASDLRFLRQFP
jgi:phenylalanyl-tRNA synthetase alpha chain